MTLWSRAGFAWFVACLASGSGACGRGRTLCGRLSAGLISIYGAEHASIIFNLSLGASTIAAGLLCLLVIAGLGWRHRKMLKVYHEMSHYIDYVNAYTEAVRGGKRPPAYEQPGNS